MLPICFGDYGYHACDKCPYNEACREATEAEEDRLAEELFGTDIEDFLVGGKEYWM